MDFISAKFINIEGEYPKQSDLLANVIKCV